MVSRLGDRGYPKWVLDKAITQAQKKDRSLLLQDKNPTKNSVQPLTNSQTPLIFSTSFSTEFKDICALINKHIPMLMYDPSLENFFKAGFRCVAKRAPTLAQDLSTSLYVSYEGRNKIGGNWLDYKGSTGCGHRVCICCSVIKRTNKILSFTSGNTYDIQQYINCNSNNVIYVINCEECRLQYVGHTTQNLKCRIRKHISDVPQASARNVSAASQHFFSIHNNSISSLSVTGVEKVSLPIRGGDIK